MVAEPGLQFCDPVEQVDDDSERRVVEGEPGAQALEAGRGGELGGGKYSSPAASRTGSSSPSATNRMTRSGCIPAARENASSDKSRGRVRAAVIVGTSD